jgi:hypothetical protein
MEAKEAAALSVTSCVTSQFNGLEDARSCASTSLVIRLVSITLPFQSVSVTVITIDAAIYAALSLS